ncbi:disease resistance protein RPS2-like, partial [Gastrolobium bilobum]|uniref:disease resistance protein RPS2-like n=1 Tax=Gastrolobium bilobum TaxID=150636 RepID=UPI002AAFB14E
MDILISIAGKVAEYTVAPIGRQACYLIFYKDNFKKLDDDVKELEDTRVRLNHSVEEERRNGKEIERDVQNWLEKVNEVIEEANQLQKDPGRARVGCSGWSFPNLILRHKLSRKASKIANVVVEVQGKGKFDPVCYLPPLDGVGSTSSTGGNEKLETRESIKEDIMHALRDPKVRNIGVYGLGGMGKTHMVMEVAQIAKQDKLFDAVVMANVSKTPDLRTIQGEIADLLGLRFDEETVVGRASRLRQRIKVEKTILVILDDIWTKLDLKKVGIPSEDEHSACKLLMTSRNKDVLVEMDAKLNFKVVVLNEAETWKLFQLMAGDVVKDINLHDIANQVAKKCAGFPLRLVTVARALKNKDIHAWNDALRQLKSVDHQGVDAMTYSALELSYKSLESDEMHVLLLFAVLGSSSVEYLLKVAMGLDIFKPINTVKDARHRFYKIVGSLKASCLLFEDNTREHIQMHDLVPEVAISIASRDQYVFFVQPKTELKWPTKNFLERCTQIILDSCHIHELPQRLDCPNVKLFCLDSANRSLEIPNPFFEGMGSLKVLDLTRLNLSSLPTSFQFLTRLQTLCLDQCILENMNEIGALKNLEILCLWKSSMTKLPREIGQLTYLRKLDLSYSGIEVFPPNIISSLTKLEELKHVIFPNLETLKLSSLNLNKIWDDGQPSISKLTNLIVENCGGLKYLFSSTMVGSFINLKRLEISKCHLMDEIIATEERNNGTASLNEVPFSKLETIILKEMENLEAIWHHQFETVKTLQVKNCKKIVVVFPCSIQETYHNLEMLEVTDCALVEKIFDLTLNENSSIEDGTQLKSITLEALPKLKRTWSRDPEGTLHFHNLENVYLSKCGSLDYLFPFSVATHCSLLKELSIKWCGNMKGIVAEKEGSMCTTPLFEFNELNTLLLWCLYKLKGFYAGNYTLACPSLRKIDVCWCAKLNLYNLSTNTDGRFLDGKHPFTVQQSLFRVEE